MRVTDHKTHTHTHTHTHTDKKLVKKSEHGVAEKLAEILLLQGRNGDWKQDILNLKGNEKTFYPL